MKVISIKELHAETGRWVRAAREQTIVVTDRGKKVAALKPHDDGMNPRPEFKGRDWSKLPKIETDSTDLISADRDRW